MCKLFIIMVNEQNNTHYLQRDKPVSTETVKKPAEPPKPLTKKDALIQNLMAKYNLKGRIGKILVTTIIDRVGEKPDVVEANLMRALLPKRIHHD